MRWPASAWPRRSPRCSPARRCRAAHRVRPQETERVIARLLRQAQATGTVRADLTVADFRLLIAAHHGVVLAGGLDAATASQRYLALMLRTLQP
ncbi:hypothetical protein AB0C15_01525 [Micromonospora sp. NPDC048835]|uniref:SbtR family transcriptional regulator n=1 Tax=Micromonospora sp. NPDC048835 TaxID=3155147 RepID=UPI003408196B